VKTDFMPGITSLSSNELLLPSTIALLQQVEALPNGATGALSFGNDGVILVERKRVCWALATDMKKRLTDILCHQQDPPLPRQVIDDVFRRCKEDGRPLGEALVSGGYVSEPQLRAALLRHTGEAIVRLAQANTITPTRFAHHEKEGYDPRFVFTTAELLASLAGRRRQELAEEAHQQLAPLLVPDISACAFLRDVRSRDPVLIAVAKGCDLTVKSAMEVASWAVSAFDIAGFCDPNARLVSATWCDRLSLMSWRHGEIGYVAVCATRAASALLLSQLAQRAQHADERTHPSDAARKEPR
jgi:hypothetical protein